MKAKLPSRIMGSALGAGLLLCAGFANASSSIVTFSVDMTYQVQTGTFLPGDTVEARGTFNGWGSARIILTNNPAASNTNVYTGTTNDTVDANNTVMQYKYVSSDNNFSPNGGYESAADGNRVGALPATSGGSLVLPTVFFSDAGAALGDGVTNVVTFQVDMSQQINAGNFVPGTSSVEVRGLFETWGGGGAPLTNNPAILVTNHPSGLVTSNVYVGTFNITGSPNQGEDYKFYINSSPNNVNYESLGPSPTTNPGNNENRWFNLGAVNNTNWSLPIVFFNNSPFAPIATNVATFQVDMSVEILRGLFTPGSDTIELQGSFTGWGTSPGICTNNPNAANTNIYSTVLTIIDGVGATDNQYKYVNTGPYQGNAGYELPVSTGGGNRIFTQPDATSTLMPAVYFSDIGPMDYLPEPTVVTFNVDMTGATAFDTGAPFDPSSDSVYLNGAFILTANMTWNENLWDTTSLAPYQLTNNPVGSSNYTISLAIPTIPAATISNTLALAYNYGIYDPSTYSGSVSNEVANAGSAGNNHVRWIRNTKNGYTLPTDHFGNTYSEAYMFNTVGHVAPASWTAPAGTVAIGWLGLPNVHLQASTSITGPWTDVAGTDGTSWTTGYLSNDGFVSVINWPFSNPQHYFRLVQPYVQP